MARSRAILPMALTMAALGPDWEPVKVIIAGIFNEEWLLEIGAIAAE